MTIQLSPDEASSLIKKALSAEGYLIDEASSVRFVDVDDDGGAGDAAISHIDVEAVLERVRDGKE